MKSSEDREILDKSETKILKNKGEWNPREYQREHGTSRGKKSKRIIYEDLLRVVCKERAEKRESRNDRIISVLKNHD